MGQWLLCLLLVLPEWRAGRRAGRGLRAWWLLSSLEPDSIMGGQGMPGPWVIGWIDSWSLSPLLIAGDRDGVDVVWRGCG